VGALEAHIAALEAMETSQEGIEPTVKAALALKDPGVLGTLGDFVEGEPAVVRGVEAFLGPMVQGLVVRDGATVNRLRAWYASRWGGRGGLILLPMEHAADTRESDGSLLRSLRLKEPGASWLRKLLGGIALAVDVEAGGEDGAASTLSLTGLSVDRMGVVRLGSPLGSAGILERRERAKVLRSQVTAAREELAAALARREEAEETARQAEAALEEAWRGLREAEDAQRAAYSEAQARWDQRTRLDRHQEELARQIEGTRASRARALDRARGAREDRALLAEEAEALRGQEEAVRQRVSEAQEHWEAARAEEARLAVEVARGEGNRARLAERIRDLRGALSAAQVRLVALAAEGSSLQEEEAAAARLREEGAAATEALFGLRERAEEELRRRDEAVGRVGESLLEADRRVRALRASEREALDRRHALELEQQELEGRLGRIQDRLEGEWGRSLEALLAEAEPTEGDPEELKEELRAIIESLEKIGPVNMLAVEEHQEESARLEFLLGQREDLRGARNDLRAAIRQINETATQRFQETFQKIRENFRSTFLRLFEGGEVDLWMEEEGDPLEATIEIHASPRGKKTQRIDLLSGGERALTALSLLFGIYLVKPSPFCVMDEVDAPLDESNIYRFIRLLEEFKRQTQFIVITHNARTIEAADWIYGVTMEEPGVSRIVGVRLEDALKPSAVAP
jgi:chromosome segregation protein